MKKSDDAFPCRLTDQDGRVLWSGNMADLRRDVRKLRELDLIRKARERKPKPEAPDAD